MLSIEPKSINLKFKTLGIPITATCVISNSSSHKTRLQISNSTCQQFALSNIKRGSFFSGESQTLVITFIPTKWELDSGIIKITCNNSDLIEIIQLNAFPNPDVNIAKLLNFGNVQVSKRKKILICLDNPLGFDIEYSIHIDNEQPHSSFLIEPKDGI
jgi:hypothetical protein